MRFNLCIIRASLFSAIDIQRIKLHYSLLWIIFTTLLCVNSFITLSQNLVPNPSFEDTSACPVGISQLYTLNWYSPTSGTPDYFNNCSSSIGGIAGVPNNWNGMEPAQTGVAYCGFIIYKIKPSFQSYYREYIQAKLINMLNAGDRYVVSFYVSLADSCDYACSSIGAYLSQSQISSTNGSHLPYIPQILNPSTKLLTNKNGWVLVSDTIKAVGGEMYITIGNFNDTTNIDTVYVGGGNQNLDFSYYYIDNVSVYTNDTLNSLGLNENDYDRMFKVYPNPSEGVLNIDMLNHSKSEVAVEIYNMYGAKVSTTKIRNKENTIDLSNQINGVYFVQFRDEKINSVKKIILQH